MKVCFDGPSLAKSRVANRYVKLCFFIGVKLLVNSARYYPAFPALLIYLGANTLYGAEIHVAPGGNDTANGAPDTPLQTIQRACDTAKPGDTIFLHGGTYREGVMMKSITGTASAPVTLVAAKGEKPILSGLDVLRLTWQVTADKKIWAATLNEKAVTQLFYNGKPLLEARWPHAPRDAAGDWNFFSPNVWASADIKGNTYGTLASAELAKTGWNVTGAQAVLNVDHQYNTWTRVVRTHASGKHVLTYDKNLGDSVDKGDSEVGGTNKWNLHNKFYLFGMKQFLGAPGEWFFDPSEKKLYLCPPDGKSPATAVIETKTRPWGLFVEGGCSHVVIDGLTFFGTAFRLGTNLNKRCFHVDFRNNTILQSSWTEYLLTGTEGDADDAGSDKVFPTINGDNISVTNNLFAYGALSALLINGFDNLIENNQFHDFDYSSSLVYPPLQVNKPYKAMEGKTGRAIVRFNSLSRSGGIQAQIAQGDNDFSMNDVSDSFLAAFGGNRDTSAVYTQQTFATGTRFHHNWVHGAFSGTPPFPWGGGIGIRGDDLTCGLTVDHNVVWDCGSVGIHIKNVEHPTPEQANRCVNNTIFAHSAYNPTKSAIILQGLAKSVKKPAGKAADGPNELSTVANNLADSIYGQWNAKPLGKVKLQAGNDTSFKPALDLTKTDWRDFRPVAGAAKIIHHGVNVEGITEGQGLPDVGAYQRDQPNYWIPGQRQAKASQPIVPDKIKGVPVDRDVLMWRPAYKAVKHLVTFAESKEALERPTATTVSKSFENDANVFKLPSLRAGRTYFWRVDAIMPDGTTVSGDTWSFSTK